MKTFYFLLLLCAGTVSAQNINFNGIIFKNKLLQSSNTSSIAKDINGNNFKIDVNSNGEITQQEAAAVYQLRIGSSSIVNLEGLEYFVNVTILACKSNDFTTIDLSTLTNLVNVDVSSNSSLVFINAKNGINETIDINGSNSSLAYICADESQVAVLVAGIPGSVNAQINIFCSTTPGGNYNTISGQVVYDNDNNVGTTNLPYPYLKLVNNFNPNIFQTISKANGNYEVYVNQSGNYNITPILENPSWFNVAVVPSSFPNTNNNNNIHNFIIAPIGINHDVEVSIRPIIPPVAGVMTNATYELVFKNKGTQMHSGQVMVNYSPTLQGYVSSSQTVTTGIGSVTHSYTNLLPFETRTITITLNTLSPLSLGSNVPITINIDTVGETPATQNDNTFTFNQKVAANANSNRIECLEGTTLPASEIGKFLHYAINFKNTGNQIAQNITIKTVIDATTFDMNSLQVLESSHVLALEVVNNQVYYKLRNIELGGPGGQGGVLMKIKSKDNLNGGSTVLQGAQIFFDYNTTTPPVLSTTNNYSTTFSNLGIGNFNQDNSIKVYPNPTSSFVTIETDNNQIIRTLELFDISGRLLQTNITGSEKTSIDLTSRNAGIYFLKINSDKGQKIEKIIKK